MAGKSKNKYDIYYWIKDEVIPSCEQGNIKQHLACNRLIKNFYKIYDDFEMQLVLRQYSDKKSRIK